ncbi:hypothetical protein QUA41_17850 [Microcoleus sp. Pol11C1]|uniref:hypothetical protein n=1 Tax=unclassified Microcoleus TaxID=2642155 RepID=UPI002FD01C00
MGDRPDRPDRFYSNPYTTRELGGDRSIIRGKTPYFTPIASIADVGSSQSHTQHRNPIAIGVRCGVRPLVRARSAKQECGDSEAWMR